jgi:hypothetical protein
VAGQAVSVQCIDHGLELGDGVVHQSINRGVIDVSIRNVFEPEDGQEDRGAKGRKSNQNRNSLVQWPGRTHARWFRLYTKVAGLKRGAGFPRGPRTMPRAYFTTCCAVRTTPFS